MKQKFVIFDFSNGSFFDAKTGKWVADQHLAYGFSEKSEAEEAIITDQDLISTFVVGHNYVILTFFYKS